MDIMGSLRNLLVRLRVVKAKEPEEPDENQAPWALEDVVKIPAVSKDPGHPAPKQFRKRLGRARPLRSKVPENPEGCYHQWIQLYTQAVMGPKQNFIRVRVSECQRCGIRKREQVAKKENA